ncbi:DEAD/DEAH box helicase [Wenzhouxiangella sp. XN79A]|uniref:DEAD/DEAH box helicase n=1 Tax=Wenzhouxiangella sp. XN79A TaxID=2724193 RepID=UPI001F10591C|nr:DEAD/DEAH box helicase [Wenzhouxiangella sp. XN79A]
MTDVSFASFDLPEAVQQSLAEAGFERCTPIQARTLPMALNGKDVAGQARTGTGKTAAFLLAIFKNLLGDPDPKAAGHHPRAVIIAPTRELAIQIHKDALSLGKHTGLRFGLSYGGVDYQKQRDLLAEGVDVLIGTPGRMIDFYKQRVFSLEKIRIAVLDEADRMFDLGFIGDIRYLFRAMPPVDKRQCLMFSATFPLKVTELAYEHMNDAETIRIDEDHKTTDRVRQTVYYPANREKAPLLVKLLRDMVDGHVIVFVNTRRAADLVDRTLRANGFDAAMLAGSVRQSKRQTLLKKFYDGTLPILVATDVAARGLHIPGVSHVINYDMPQDAADYVHRIGRTARLGATGEAISFACEDYAFHLPEIEDYIGKPIPMEEHDVEALPTLERPLPPKKKDDASGGRRGGGGGGGGRRRGGRRGGGGGRA